VPIDASALTHRTAMVFVGNGTNFGFQLSNVEMLTPIFTLETTRGVAKE
jgi:hypothetical protein